IIQSSQPSSLKLTCRVFLLHRVFAFLPCPLPPARAAIVVLRLLLSLEGVSWPGSGGSKNGGFSFLLLCEKATRRALSWGWGWGLLKAPSRDRAKLRFAGGFRRMRSSAPTTSSVSGRLETSKRYIWPASAGESSGREKAKSLSPCTAPPAELSGVSAPPHTHTFQLSYRPPCCSTVYWQTPEERPKHLIIYFSFQISSLPPLLFLWNPSEIPLLCYAPG
uniref:Uncharacterized protein n=1 Tax=Chelonoidis abingdonii TaxID=106734 RepID=A0A8C0H8R8_CHEAB